MAHRCRIRGRLRLSGVRTTNPVAVGDEVECEAADDGACAITAVLPRRNYVIRRASNLSKESHILAANLDQALLLATLAEPVTPPEFFDRFLVTCEAYSCLLYTSPRWWPTICAFRMPSMLRANRSTCPKSIS